MIRRICAWFTVHTVRVYFIQDGVIRTAYWEQRGTRVSEARAVCEIGACLHHQGVTWDTLSIVEIHV